MPQRTRKSIEIVEGPTLEELGKSLFTPWPKEVVRFLLVGGDTLEANVFMGRDTGCVCPPYGEVFTLDITYYWGENGHAKATVTYYPKTRRGTLFFLDSHGQSEYASPA